jgi:pimeloyl-ACP methyl ester carboxylesterase
MEPEIKFCRSADGTEIGYAKLGAGRPLVCATPWMGDFESAWDYPGGRDFFTTLAQRRTVILGDLRGTGLSQREVADESLEALVADLAAISESEGLENFDMFAGYGMAAAAATYAAENAGRVPTLVCLALTHADRISASRIRCAGLPSWR